MRVLTHNRLRTELAAVDGLSRDRSAVNLLSGLVTLGPMAQPRQNPQSKQ